MTRVSGCSSRSLGSRSGETKHALGLRVLKHGWQRAAGGSRHLPEAPSAPPVFACDPSGLRSARTHARAPPKSGARLLPPHRARRRREPRSRPALRGALAMAPRLLTGGRGGAEARGLRGAALGNPLAGRRRRIVSRRGGASRRRRSVGPGPAQLPRRLRGRGGRYRGSAPRGRGAGC